jgi:hypothetical protein
MRGNNTIPQWVWWTKGKCVVEVLKTGHFPTSVIAKLPDGLETEIDMDELELIEGKL